MTRWEYLTVRSGFVPRTPDVWSLWSETLLESSDGRTFATPDAALQMLGSEGWECIQFHQDDGPRQQIAPGSLLQAPPWPKQYTLRFKRAAMENQP